jgi:hypothetical protein
MEEDMRTLKRRLQSLMLAIFASVLVACAAAKPLPSLDDYAHQLHDGTVVLFWNCSRPEPGLVQVAGWANNPFYPQPIKDLGFTLYGMNAQGIVVSTTQASAQALQIFTNDPVAFTINLQTTGAEAQYQLFYDYYFSGDREAQLSPGGYWRKVANNICPDLAP